MGSSKKQTVGYKYYLGMHMILCHGPIDFVKRITVDKRVAWTGKSPGGRINIEAESLFGGEEREGGVSGAVDLEMGRNDQGRNDYLQARLGTSIPAFRKVVGLVLRQCYLGLNPYLKPWGFRGQRIHVRQDGIAQWYDAKAEIVVAGDYTGPQAYFFVIDASGSMNEMSGSMTRINSVKQAMTAALDRMYENAVAAGVALDVGVAFYSSSGFAPNGTVIVRRAVNAGAVQDVKDFVNAVTPDGGTEPKYGFSHANSFFNGTAAGFRKVCVHLTDGRPLCSGYTEFTPEGMQCAVDEALASSPDIFYADSDVEAHGINMDEEDTTYTAQLDNTGNSVPVVEGGDPTAILDALRFTVGIGHSDLNPAHIIRECLTDPDWGMGYADADVDDASFTYAADVLYSEGMGMSILWDRQTPIEDFINEVVKHIAASLYVDRTTGKFVLKLIRADYDRESLLVLDESHIQKVEGATRPTAGELVNSVTAVYWDYATGENGSVTVQDQALVQMQGAVINTTLQYPGFSHQAISSRAALRALTSLSVPLLSCTIYADRVASGLNIGDVFRMTWPDLQVDDLVMRVTAMALGDGKTNVVKLTAVEDVFSFPEASVVTTDPTPPTNDIDPSAPAQAASVRMATEMPYYEAAQQFGQATVDSTLASGPEAGYVMAACARPGAEQAVAMQTDPGTGFEDAAVFDFCPGAVLSVGIGRADTVLQVTSAVDLDLVELGTWAMLGGVECVRVDAVNVLAGEVTVARGVHDTVPTEHAAGAQLLMLDFDYGADPTEYVAGELVDVRLLPFSGSGRVASSSAPVDTVALGGRGIRPYPPGNVRINGTHWPEFIGGTDGVELEWSHRDRLQQTGAVLIGFTDGDVGPEAGVTYTLRIYGEDGVTLGREVTGLTVTSYNYPTSAEFDDFPDLGSLGPWTPSLLTTRAWYDFSDEVSVTEVSGAVASIADKSGNGFTLSQGTTADRPAYGATINGLKVATFDGSNDRLNAAVALLGVTHSLFIVFKPTVESASGSLIGQWASGQTGRFLVTTNQNCQGIAASGRLNPFNSSTTGGACTGSGSNLLADMAMVNAPSLFASVSTTGSESWKVYNNGTEAESGTVTALYTGVNTALGSVSASQLSNPYDGQIAEVVLLPTVVSLEVRQKIEGYLAHKWGFAASLPVGHPYRDAAPTAPVGDSRLNGRLRIVLESVRDGYTSYQAHDYTVRRHGYGFNYGESYGE